MAEISVKNIPNDPKFVEVTHCNENGNVTDIEIMPNWSYGKKTQANSNEKKPFLRDAQLAAVYNMFDGCILNGGTGSGKSRTSLYYYFSEFGGEMIYPDEYVPMENPPDLYIITPAQKRDKLEWEKELLPFRMSTDPKNSMYNHKIVVDSWNNIGKYADVTDAFFIFDEQRLTGKGPWVKAFLTIAKFNRWILLSATPGDTWMDYVPVFIANGFYKNRTEFAREHVVYSHFTNYPVVSRYLGEGKLIRLRKKLLIDIDMKRETVQHHDDIYCQFDVAKYKDVTRKRWDPYDDMPIENASGLCYVLRKVVNTDETRVATLLQLLEKHPRAIIFYNFDYELELLKSLHYGEGVEVAEWNGHAHQPVPKGDKWIYLVQYTAGSDAWNCTTTDTMIFFSQNYSYKVMKQASGRIDRLDTPYKDLYYYHLKTRSGIDLAISKALKTKKKFNEKDYAKTLSW